MPHDAHPMGVLVSAMSALSIFHPDANPALRVSFNFKVLSTKSILPYMKLCIAYLMLLRSLSLWNLCGNLSSTFILNPRIK